MSNYNPTTLMACADSALADINQLDNEIRARLQWSDVQMLDKSWTQSFLKSGTSGFLEFRYSPV